MRVALAFIFAGTALTLNACAGVTELSVGSTPTPADGGIGVTKDGSPTGTLLERLEQKCAAQPGAIDTYTNAAELSARLNGRWYHCGSIGNWSLPRGTGLELAFGTTGSYAFLSYADPTETFTPSTDPDMSGEVDYVVFAGLPSDGGADGGDAAAAADASPGGMMSVAVDDTTTRNGLFVDLARTTDDLQFQMIFEQNPRKLHTNELGGTPVFATFVPID